MRARVAALFAVLALSSCSRCRGTGPAPPVRTELTTALSNFQTEIAAARTDDERKKLARFIVEVSDLHDASFARYGDVYHHHVYPEPQFSCIQQRSCFSGYLAFLVAKEREELASTRTDVDARANVLLGEFSVRALAEEIARREEYIAKRVAQLPGTARGSGSRTVFLISTGHPVEARRNAAIDRVLAAHAGAIRFIDVGAPADVLDALGRRATAVAVLDGVVRKDVVEEDQWLEWLGQPLPTLPRKYPELRLIDAHEHVSPGAGARLEAILADQGGAVIAALPGAVSFATTNDAVLGVASAKFFPLVTLDEQAADARSTMVGLIDRGARGLKLLTGHDDYHRAHGRPQLDPASLRAVLAELEARGLPVLWHVNTHLFVDGFLRALSDFPRLKVVCPHFAGYLTYAPSIVRALLDKYPNLYIDISLGTQPRYLRRSMEDLSARRDEWRKLFIDHADRFLYGRDMVVNDGTSQAHARMLERLYRGMLEDESFDLHYFPARGSSTIAEESHHHDAMPGLALPKEVLRKIYSANAAAIYGLSP